MEGLYSADPSIDFRMHAPLCFLSKARRAYSGCLSTPAARRTMAAHIRASQVGPSPGGERTAVFARPRSTAPRSGDVREVRARNAPVCGAKRAGVWGATRRCAGRNAPVFRAQRASVWGATRQCFARNAPVFGTQRAGVRGATRRCFARNAPVFRAQRAGVRGATRRCFARNAPVCGARATPARSARFASNPEPSGSGARSLWSRPAWSCSLRLRCRTPSPCPLRARRS